MIHVVIRAWCVVFMVILCILFMNLYNVCIAVLPTSNYFNCARSRHSVFIDKQPRMKYMCIITIYTSVLIVWLKALAVLQYISRTCQYMQACTKE